MGEVNFYLKAAGKSGKSLIGLFFRYNGRRLKFSFGQSINPKNWNSSKQRVKNNNQTTSDGKYLLNDLLDTMAQICLSAYNKEITKGIPEPATLRKHLQNFMNQNEEDPDGPTLFKLLDRFINNEIKHKGRSKSDNTIKTYRTLKGHLLEYQAVKKQKVDFESITLDFYYSYVDFLSKRDKYASQIRAFRPELKAKPIGNLEGNSISKDIQILKVIMAEAVDMGFTQNLQFKHKKFAVSREDTDAVFLTEKEIVDLYRFKFTNKRIEQVRDLFVFGCFVGLRFSDYSDVKPENIVKIDGDHFIKLITKKTKDLVIIPCNPIVLEIFKKYESNHNKLPRSISNQNFNEYIKEACLEAGFTEVGRLSTAPQKELWECISSHTARRSFATNYYLEGFPTIYLMKITGHRTEKAFMKYIRVTKLDTARRLNTHIKKNWSEKMLRVAS